MSSPSPTRDVEDDSSEVEQVFSISLIVYSKVKKMLRGKSALKEEKTMKTKELSFAIQSLNYVDFLRSMLQKHGQEDYEVTAKKHYPFRYTLPKTKGYRDQFLFIYHKTRANGEYTRQRVADAIDVDNVADYQEMVTKIADSKPPAIIKILVDMRDVQKLPRAQASSSETDGGSETSPKGIEKVHTLCLIYETQD